MQPFQHNAPPLRLFHGADSLTFLRKELERLGGRRAVVVCGRSLAREGALIGQILAAMADRCAGVIAGVRAHSPAPAVEAVANELRQLDADTVVVVGGGSAIVTARAATILLAERGDLASLATAVDASGKLRSPKLLAPKLPQLIVPTTPTTAMTRAGSAVLDPAAGERRALFDPKTRAHAIFVHPDFARSAPRDLVVSSGLNTFAFALEGLTSPTGDPVADALLMHGLKLVAQNLADPRLAEDAEVRSALIVASVLCGQGTNATGAGVVTALSHAIGARHAVENGIAAAILLPHTLRFNAEFTRAGLRKAATALGLMPTDAALVETIAESAAQLFAALGVPKRLRDVKVPQDALPAIAELAMNDWFLRGNPRRVRAAQELQRILEEAW